MKTRTFPPVMAAALCLLSLLACEKESPTTITVDLPDSVEFGKSVVYLNGELTEVYKPDFQLDTIYHLMNYIFIDSTISDVITVWGFAWLPIKEGNFELHTERLLYVKALVQFSQIVDGDLDGYDYELIDANEGFLNIEHLDTVKMEVKGRFRVKFKRTTKNGNGDLGLPEFLQFDGAFYDKVRLRW
ncbi:MAG: hypothetical protein KF734_10600 [Saprospiraceae bacterium]|nr:hypothetical protein [Saprospiraceae bacterium]